MVRLPTLILIIAIPRHIINNITTTGGDVPTNNGLFADGTFISGAGCLRFLGVTLLKRLHSIKNNCNGTIKSF